VNVRICTIHPNTYRIHSKNFICVRF
jgi:hypothetical protein